MNDLISTSLDAILTSLLGDKKQNYHNNISFMYRSQVPSAIWRLWLCFHFFLQ